MKMLTVTVKIVGKSPLCVNRYRPGRGCCCPKCNERLREMQQWAIKRYGTVPQ